MSEDRPVSLADIPLPAGIRSRLVSGINGLTMHVLEAGFETKDRPCVLLLHGFPELAYSWRKVMPSLAAAGYHVIAPDQRGYAGTSPKAIQERSGAGQGSMYHHFHGKPDLALVATYPQLAERSLLGSAPSTDPMARLEAVVEEFTRQILDY